MTVDLRDQLRQFGEWHEDRQRHVAIADIVERVHPVGQRPVARRPAPRRRRGLVAVIAAVIVTVIVIGVPLLLTVGDGGDDPADQPTPLTVTTVPVPTPSVVDGAAPVVVPGVGTLTWTKEIWPPGQGPDGFAQADASRTLRGVNGQLGAQMDETTLRFDHTGFDIDIATQLALLEAGVEGTNEYPLLARGDNGNWVEVATIQAGPMLQIDAGDSFWVYGPYRHGAPGIVGPGIVRYQDSATIWISSDAQEWVPVDISFSWWQSIVTVGGDTIYISGPTVATGTTVYWIGTFEQP